MCVVSHVCVFPLLKQTALCEPHVDVVVLAGWVEDSLAFIPPPLTAGCASCSLLLSCCAHVCTVCGVVEVVASVWVCEGGVARVKVLPMSLSQLDGCSALRVMRFCDYDECADPWVVTGGSSCCRPLAMFPRAAQLVSLCLDLTRSVLLSLHVHGWQCTYFAPPYSSGGCVGTHTHDVASCAFVFLCPDSRRRRLIDFGEMKVHTRVCMFAEPRYMYVEVNADDTQVLLCCVRSRCRLTPPPPATFSIASLVDSLLGQSRALCALILSFCRLCCPFVPPIGKPLCVPTACVCKPPLPPQFTRLYAAALR